VNRNFGLAGNSDHVAMPISLVSLIRKLAKSTGCALCTSARKIRWVCAACFPKLSLGVIKICDFFFPIYDLAKNSIPYL